MGEVKRDEIVAVARHAQDLARLLAVGGFVSGCGQDMRDHALAECRVQLSEARHVVATLARGVAAHARWTRRRDVLARLVMAADLAGAATEEERLELQLEAEGDMDLTERPGGGLGGALELEAYCEAGVGA